MNKRHLYLLLIGMFTMTIGGNIAAAQQSSVPSQFYGVWSRGGEPEFSPNPSTNPGGSAEAEKFDFLKGKGITKSLKWSEIQPLDNGVFEFKPFKDAIEQALADGQLITLKINVGPQAPIWIYGDETGLKELDGKVALVLTDSTSEKFKRHPYYLDPDYAALYFELIEEFAAFVDDELDLEEKAIISFIFPQTGATGDEVPYKGNLTEFVLDDDGEEVEKYEIGDEAWGDFRMAAWLKWSQEFGDMPFLYNDLKVDSREWIFVRDDIGTKFGIKNSNAYARGHHLTGERTWHEAHHKFLVNPAANTEGPNEGLALFNRAEMDQSWENDVFQVNQNLGFYWSAIGGLNTGLSVWDVTTKALAEAGKVENESIRESFRFFNKYATQIDPATSTKAFIALHEGLDVTDTDKFPESDEDFGKLKNRGSIERYETIVAAYEDRGALLCDKAAVVKGQVSQRSDQLLYNDVGWEIWPTNYSRFITQVDPDAESIGLFRVGIEDGVYTASDSIYSRFARSFEHKTGRNRMNFKMEAGFFTSAAGTVKFTITYYDKNEFSTWELQYDAGEGNLKTAALVKCDGTNEWITKEFTVTDADMQNNGPGVPDFALVNTDMDDTLTEEEEDGSLDDIFHMIEIEQLPGVPFLLGDGNLDGAVNFLDIAPFIARLTSGTHQEEVDINGDDLVNFLDIAPFIAILGAG